MSPKKIHARKSTKSAFQKRYSGWAPIVRKLKAGKYPDHSELADTLRSMKVPQIPAIVRDHIAGLIDGSIKPPKGRKKQNSFTDIAHNAAVQMRYEEELEKIRQEEDLANQAAKQLKQNRRLATREKKSTAHQRALKATAAAFFRSEDWVKDRIYTGRLFRDKRGKPTE